LDETGTNAGMQKGLMRHANMSTTMNTYGRAAIEAKQEALIKMMQMTLPRRTFALSLEFCGVVLPWRIGNYKKRREIWLLR
jgi:hypothetical protein